MRIKKKYLIVMPRFIQNNGDGYQFPLGICYISSSLKAKGYDVHTMNLNHQESPSDLEKYIRSHEIDVVMTGGLSVHYQAVRDILQTAKRVDQNMITIVGGGLVTGDPEVTMTALEYADYGVIGEGELTSCELCEVLEMGCDAKSVAGLIYFDEGGDFVRTAPRKENEDISSLPWPDYEGFDFQKTLTSTPGISGMNSENMAFMISSRSCPYDCTFCFHTVGRKYRQRSLDEFFDEVDYVINKYKIQYLCLEDELFSQNMERVKEFCRRIKKYNIKYWVQVRVTNVNREILSLLRESGCDTICFGLESADNRILNSMRKKITIEQIEQALEYVKESGIQILGNFIFGDINETMETATNTINWWKEHLEYKIEFSMISIYPGTYLYKYAIANGYIKDAVQYLKDGCPQINVSKLSDDEFGELLQTLLELPKKYAINLKSLSYTNIDYKLGRADAHGYCSACGEYNTWQSVKLFMINYLGCSECGQKHSLHLTEDMMHQLEENLSQVLGYKKNIALWGMNLNANDLINKVALLQHEHVHLVDISQVAQKTRIANKKVHSPAIIGEKQIEMVIVCIPHHFAGICNRIAKEYPEIKAVINIIDLLDPQFEGISI